MHSLPIVETSSEIAPLASLLPERATELSSGPVARVPQSLMPQAGDPIPPILVAEDDVDDTFFIQRLIRKTGVKNPVKVFDDGTEVVNYLSGRAQSMPAALRRRTPLLLFLDLKMKGLGGFGFLEWARQQKEIGPITIVVLSNSSEPEDMARALELGAHRYLVKYPSAHTFDSIIRGVYPQTVY